MSMESCIKPYSSFYFGCLRSRDQPNAGSQGGQNGSLYQGHFAFIREKEKMLLPIRTFRPQKHAKQRKSPVRTNFLTGFHWRSERDLFAFSSKAKIKVATSVCTGGSNMPVAYCISGIQIPLT
jgi:hypothetical protein